MSNVMNAQDTIMILTVLVLLCLLSPIVIGIISTLVNVMPYLFVVLLVSGMIAFFRKQLR